MCHRALRYFCLAALLTLSGARPTLAAIVESTPFSTFGRNECPLSGGCFVEFETVPEGHIYDIHNVSCYFSISNLNARPLYLYFTAADVQSQYGRIHLQPTRLGVTTTVVTYNATANALVRAPAGARLIVNVDRDSSTPGGMPNIDCTISGMHHTID